MSLLGSFRCDIYDCTHANHSKDCRKSNEEYHLDYYRQMIAAYFCSHFDFGSHVVGRASVRRSLIRFVSPMQQIRKTFTLLYFVFINSWKINASSQQIFHCNCRVNRIHISIKPYQADTLYVAYKLKKETNTTFSPMSSAIIFFNRCAEAVCCIYGVNCQNVFIFKSFLFCL